MNIFLADEQDEPLGTGPLRRLVRTVMEEEGLPDDTEVSILFVSQEQITQYNEQFMQRTGPTDVLAFPLEQLRPGEPPDRRTGAPPLNLGDVVIAPSYVRDQAESIGVAFEDELSLMVVHGLLHLLGYDHQIEDDAERMEKRERELLALSGVPRR